MYEHVERSFNVWEDLTDHVIESKFLIADY